MFILWGWLHSVELFAYSFASIKNKDVLYHHLGVGLVSVFMRYEADLGMIRYDYRMDGEVRYICHHGIAC